MRFKNLLCGATAATALLLAQAEFAYAQQVSASLRGVIVDVNGEAVGDAQIQIVNTRTGATTSAMTGDGGSFAATGLPIGGPYTVKVTAAGSTKMVTGIFLTLGETSKLNITVGEAVAEEVVVSGTRNKAGTSTATIETRGVAMSFNADQIRDQPKMDRDFKELIQQSPYAYIDPVGGGSSPPVATLNIAGANPRCQNFLVDGLQQKDNFGLNLQGYPTARSPLPTDWADQVEVAVTPYDVEYNDTCGGVVNIVTKTGSNDFHGTGYYYWKNSDLGGSKIRGTNPTKPPFQEESYGFTITGPIIEDTLFFFAGYDHLTHSGPLSNAVGPNGSNAARIATGISQAEVDQISNIAQTTYGFDPLRLADAFTEVNDRYIGKLTWQINDQHRVVATYQNVVGGTLTLTGGSTSTTTPQVTLPSNWYKDTEELTAYSLQEYSDWTSNFSTQFHIGRVDIHGGQDPLNGTAFPEVYVRTPGLNGVYNLGTSAASNNASDDGYVRIGPDFSRHFNSLDYVNDFAKLLGTYTLDTHVLKAGVEGREISIFNAFVQGAQSVVRFDSISAFAAGNIAGTLDTRANATSSGTYAGNPIYYGSGPGGDLSVAAAIFKFRIYSGYIQDEWFADSDFSVQAGLRYDRYASDDKPALNANFTSRYGFSNQKNLDGLDIWLPRVSASYNWQSEDMDFIPDETDVAIRGGVGRYSGGFQTVWISNSYSVTGVTQVNAFGRPGFTSANGDFTAVPTNILTGGSYDHDAWLDKLNNGPLAAATASRNSTVNAILPNFKIPNTWRANLGTDIAFGDGWLGDGWHATMEYLYLESKAQPYWTNLRIQPSANRAPDGRILYQWTFDPPNGRPDPAGNATAVTGSDIGLGSFDGGTGKFIILAARKSWDDTGYGDFTLNLGYTHSKVTEVNPSTSSTANSNYVNVAAVDYNEPAVGTSDYERRHRLTAGFNVVERFFGDLETRLNIFGQKMSGQHYSLVFNGNPFGPSGGGTTGRSLVYVPQIDTATGLVTATSDPRVTYAGGFDLVGFNQMLNDTGLIKYAGRIAPRNAFEGPWDTLVNLSLAQELPVPMLDDHKVVLEMSVFNLGNLLNKNWGTFASPSFYQAYSAVTADNLTPGAPYRYTAFNTTSQMRSNIANRRDASTWQVQFGVRYEF